MSNDTRSGDPAKKAAAKKATAARRAEAKQDGGLVEFEFEGHSYSFERAAIADDVEFFELAEDGKMISACKKVLGPKQWAEFKARVRNEDGRVPAGITDSFLDALLEASGLGNS